MNTFGSGMEVAEQFLELDFFFVLQLEDFRHVKGFGFLCHIQFLVNFKLLNLFLSFLVSTMQRG